MQKKLTFFSWNRGFLFILLLLILVASCVQKPPSLEKGTRLTPLGMATQPAVPLAVTSDETTAQQLQFARNQGQAAEEALYFLIDKSSGGEMMAGGFQLAYLLEKPKGYYQLSNGQMQWHEPTEDAFLSLVVRDGYDGRPISGLQIKASLLRQNGEPVFEKEQFAFGWHPLLHRYGKNITIPEDGTYTLKVKIAPPTFWRHDPVNGDRFADTVRADFQDISLIAGNLKDPLKEAPLEEWLTLAKAQGRALRRALDAMIGGVAVDGSVTQLSPYWLAYAVEYAEGYWRFKNGKLQYNMRVEGSAEKNAHIEVAPLDAFTGRILPDLQLTTTFYQKQEKIGTYTPKLMWHPWLFHYGDNIRVPKSGQYQVEVSVMPPPYPIYSREWGASFGQPISFRFQDVNIKTGQK